MSSAKWWPFCIDLNVLRIRMQWPRVIQRIKKRNCCVKTTWLRLKYIMWLLGQWLNEVIIIRHHYVQLCLLAHWGRVCISKLTIIGSDNGLSPGRRQAIIWTNAGILLIWPLGTNFNEILIEIHIFPFKKMRLKWRPFFLGLNMPRGLVMLYDVDPGCLWMAPEPIISKVHRWPW